jgi:vacuolar-type H+-ATPase subunit H
MELLDLLDQMDDMLEHGANIPLTGRCIVRRDEILDLIQEIRLKLPEDIKQAKNIALDREKIIVDASQEAENIIKNAESRISALVDEHEITRKAYEQAEIIMNNAKKNSRDIRMGTREYADGVLIKVESVLAETLDVIRSNRQELK